MIHPPKGLRISLSPALVLPVSNLSSVLQTPIANFSQLLADVGFPSVCEEYVLLPLDNNEAALVNRRAEYSQAGRGKERE